MIALGRFASELVERLSSLDGVQILGAKGLEREGMSELVQDALAGRLFSGNPASALGQCYADTTRIRFCVTTQL